MERDFKTNIKYDGKDNKLSDDPLVRQIDNDTFAIRINLELRKRGIYQIILTKCRLSILDIDENIVISVTNYKNINGLYSRLEDQLANTDSYMSYQFLGAVWDFFIKSKTSLSKIIEYFQNQELKGDGI